MTNYMSEWLVEQGVHKGHLQIVLLLLGAESDDAMWFYAQLVAFYTLAFRYASGEWDLTMPVPRDILRGLWCSHHPTPQCLPHLHHATPYVLSGSTPSAFKTQEHIIHCVREWPQQMTNWLSYPTAAYAFST